MRPKATPPILRQLARTVAAAAVFASCMLDGALAGEPRDQSSRSTQSSSHSKWGKYQPLISPQSRLTFLVQNAYLEKLERELRDSPKISRFLMRKLSLSTEERIAAIQDYRQWWMKHDEQWSNLVSKGVDRNEISSLQVRRSYFDQIGKVSAKQQARIQYVKLVLEQGFHDYTLAGHRAVEGLESEKNFEVRIVQLATVLGYMVRDQDSLEVLASISNFLLEIGHEASVDVAVRSRIVPHAVELSKKVAKALRDSRNIDILNPFNLVGGGVFFKGASHIFARSAAKSVAGQSLISGWIKAPAVAKASAASIVGHAAVLSRVDRSNSTPTEDEALIQAARERLQNPGKIVIENPNLYKNLTTSSLSMEGLTELAYQIVYQGDSSKAAWKSAELIAFAERFAIATRRQSFDETRLEMQPSRLLEIRNEIALRFKRYMTKRGLTSVDEEAISVLRNHVAPYITHHEDDQAVALLAMGAPKSGGNCVTRSMIYTALFYPILEQFKSPNFQFGLAIWTNHIEPVLYMPKVDQAISIHSMNLLPKESRPSLVDPRVVAASFLFRASSARLHGQDRSKKVFPLYPKAKLAFWRGEFFDLGVSKSELEMVRETDPNVSALISWAYADRIKVQPSVQEGLNSRLATANSISEFSKVRDFLKLVHSGRSPTNGFVRGSNSSEHVDPWMTALSAVEVAVVLPSRKPTLFPFSFDAQMLKIAYPAGTYLSRKGTPYPTREDVERRLKEALDAVVEGGTWKKMASPDGISLQDFAQDANAQIAIMDFGHFLRGLQRTFSSPYFASEVFDFAKAVDRYFDSTSGLYEEYDQVARNAKKILSPLVSDKSGVQLAKYLRGANGLSSADKVRRVQALYVLVRLANETESIKTAFKNVDLDVLKVKAASTKNSEKSSLSSPKPQVTYSFAGNKQPTFVVTIQGNNETARVPLAIEQEVAFLLLHFFREEIPNAHKLLQNMVESSESGTAIEQTAVFKFGAKFFSWMPSVDLFGSWQNQLAERWVDFHTEVCWSKAGESSPGKSSPDFQASQRTCDFLRGLGGELMFEEILANYKSANLD